MDSHSGHCLFIVIFFVVVVLTVVIVIVIVIVGIIHNSLKNRRAWWATQLSGFRCEINFLLECSAFILTQGVFFSSF